MKNSIYPIVNAIRNPTNGNHFMVIKPIDRAIKIYAGDRLLASTTSALRVLEVGKSVYDPVVYIPLTDIIVALEPIEKATHCPLKGDAHYLTLDGDEIGWTYDNPLDFADALSGHVAFWPNKVRLVEGG